MLIVGEARCAACGHDHKLTRTGVLMVCGYCLCDEQKFSARNAAREPSVTMVEPPELSADARMLLERAWTRTGEVDGSESAGGVEGHAFLGADQDHGDAAPDRRRQSRTVAGIKPGPALSLPPNDDDLCGAWPDTVQEMPAGGVLEQAPPAGEVSLRYTDACRALPGDPRGGHDTSSSPDGAAGCTWSEAADSPRPQPVEARRVVPPVPTNEKAQRGDAELFSASPLAFAGSGAATALPLSQTAAACEGVQDDSGNAGYSAPYGARRARPRVGQDAPSTARRVLPPSPCSLVAILERRGYLFWNCACGREARIGVMLEGTARAAWARHAKEQ